MADLPQVSTPKTSDRELQKVIEQIKSLRQELLRQLKALEDRVSALE